MRSLGPSPVQNWGKRFNFNVNLFFYFFLFVRGSREPGDHGSRRIFKKIRVEILLRYPIKEEPSTQQIKTYSAEHPQALARILQRPREHNLKMNPKKCVFGVSSGKLLGFIVSKKGIKIDPNKAKTIVEMPPPKNLKEVRGLIGRLQFIRRFISQDSKRCWPFYELLKGGAHFD